MPSFKLDGKTIPFEPGDTVIRAAWRQGIEIPHYCWHPGLSAPANCRMVLLFARQHLSRYLRLPNYVNNLVRGGFTDDDVSGGGSDRLVDAVVVCGDEATIARRVQEHRDAGADHVCIQVLTEERLSLPRAAWRALAPALM